MFSLHWNRDTQVALQVFAARSSSTTLVTGSVARDNTRLIFKKTFQQVRCVERRQDERRLKHYSAMCKNIKVTCLLGVYWSRAGTMLQPKSTCWFAFIHWSSNKKTDIQPCSRKRVPDLLGQEKSSCDFYIGVLWCSIHAYCCRMQTSQPKACV